MAKPKKTSRTKRNSSYTPSPVGTEEAIERLIVVLKVETGELTVTAAAKLLGLSRNHFQSLRNKAVQAALDALTPQLPGRPRKDPKVVELEETIEELVAENDSLHNKNEILQGAVNSLTEMVRETSKVTRKKKRGRSRGSKTKETTEDD